MPSSPASEIITYADIEAAAKILDGIAVKTPVLESPLLNAALGFRLRVKAEPLQVTGSFKFRGAYNAISRIPDDRRKAGVVAFSSGNHAQGVAAAANMLGLPATILMPEDAPKTKIELTRAWGAEIITFNRFTESREELGETLMAERGATLIKPYDAPLIMAGQGTLAAEAVTTCLAGGWAPDLFISPAGGGGLIAGCSTAVRALSPETKIYSSEPAGFDDTARSLEAGTRVANDPEARSICDALLAPEPGELTFQVNSETLTGGLCVTDDEAMTAMAVAFKYLKLVVEPGGAVALAAAVTGKVDCKGKNVLVVCSGGNADADIYAEALSRPLPF
ncbi:MAG: pyridoxal-5'-phosphate-dependent protein [Rhodospirillaceae bacterium]|nr:pyridoxal-5'-phosphate-dependent protein [Rhodospirillaceae bacterium]